MPSDQVGRRTPEFVACHDLTLLLGGFNDEYVERLGTTAPGRPINELRPLTQVKAVATHRA